MKFFFTSALLFLAVSAFAQDTKKDSAATNDYGMRIYDARLKNYMSVDPKASQNNPYNFTEQKIVSADSTKVTPATNKPKKQKTIN